MLNYALYQIGWLTTVIGVREGNALLGGSLALILAAVHLVLTQDRKAECRLMLIAGAVGLVIDSTQIAIGLLHFKFQSLVPWLCPPWIIVMWIQFATTLRFSLRRLLHHPLAAATFGATGGPLVYVAGEGLGLVELSSPRSVTLVVISVLWALALTGLCTLAGRSKSERDYRIDFPTKSVGA